MLADHEFRPDTQYWEDSAMNLPLPRRSHRSVAYYWTRDDASQVLRIVRKRFPGARIVYYMEGWTVQYYRSGPYYPEREAQAAGR